MRFKIYFVLFLIVVFAVRCSKNSNPKPTPQIKAADVYVAGITTTSAGTHIATYWKNDTAINLTDNSSFADANAIAINGKDVYIAGFAMSNGDSVATYWKNNVATRLTYNSKGSFANTIIVNGSDIYVAGFTRDNSGNQIATYWKNGIATILPSNSPSSFANSIVIDGSDVYVAGITISSTYILRAAYWKNGSFVQLPDNLSGSTAYSIMINNKDVYVGGSINTVNGYLAAYWKNGVITTIGDNGSKYSQINSIVMQGSDTYASGDRIISNGNTVATYWKNDQAVDLQGSLPGSLGFGIAINGSDVYISGASTVTGAYYPVATYWKNRQIVQLEKSGATASYAIAIAVVPR